MRVQVLLTAALLAVACDGAGTITGEGGDIGPPPHQHYGIKVHATVLSASDRSVVPGADARIVHLYPYERATPKTIDETVTDPEGLAKMRIDIGWEWDIRTCRIDEPITGLTLEVNAEGFSRWSAPLTEPMCDWEWTTIPIQVELTVE